MIAGGGKRKGGAYEREVCRKLSLWITEGEDDSVLWRSASSGAVSTNRRKKGQKSMSSQAGDIAAVDPRGQQFIDLFSVEAKHVANLQMDGLVFKTPSVFKKFWVKHKSLCDEVGKSPIIIARQNRKPDIIAISLIRLPFENFSLDWVQIGSMGILPLEEFLTKVNYKEFIGHNV